MKFKFLKQLMGITDGPEPMPNGMAPPNPSEGYFPPTHNDPDKPQMILIYDDEMQWPEGSDPLCGTTAVRTEREFIGYEDGVPVYKEATWGM